MGGPPQTDLSEVAIGCRHLALRAIERPVATFGCAIAMPHDDVTERMNAFAVGFCRGNGRTGGVLCVVNRPVAEWARCACMMKRVTGPQSWHGAVYRRDDGQISTAADRGRWSPARSGTAPRISCACCALHELKCATRWGNWSYGLLVSPSRPQNFSFSPTTGPATAKLARFRRASA